MLDSFIVCWRGPPTAAPTPRPGVVAYPWYQVGSTRFFLSLLSPFLATPAAHPRVLLACCSYPRSDRRTRAHARARAAPARRPHARAASAPSQLRRHLTPRNPHSASLTRFSRSRTHSPLLTQKCTRALSRWHPSRCTCRLLESVPRRRRVMHSAPSRRPDQRLHSFTLLLVQLSSTCDGDAFPSLLRIC